MKSKTIGYLSLTTAASIWGGMYVVSKFAMDYIEPYTLVWIRYLIAFIVMSLIYLVYKNRTPLKSISKSDLIVLILIGVIGYFISITCQFYGTFLSNAHTGSLITSATPAFMTVFAWKILNEKMTIKKIAALIISSAGILTIIGFEHIDSTFLLGVVILSVAAISWALMSVLVKKASASLDIVTVTLVGITIGLVSTTPLMISEVSKTIPTIDYDLILACLYIGVVSTAGAFFLWNYGLKLVEASKGSLFFFLQPIVGTILGYFMLGETLTINFFIGSSMIILSVLLTLDINK
ncbi:EamA family transporter [Mycoplasmatota bacterium WC44]